MHPFIRSVLRASVLVCILAVSSAQAHEGHDHGPAATPVPSTHQARAEATSELFELVAVVRAESLAIYVDRFATNEPVEGATIEVDTPVGPVTAQARSGDGYVLDAPWLQTPGRYDLIFTVTSGDAVDVLPLSIEVPAASPRAQPRTWSWFSTAAWAGELKQSLEPYQVSLALAAFGGFGAGIILMAWGRRRGRQVHVGPLMAAFLLMAGSGSTSAHEGHDHGPPPAAAAPAGDLAQRLPDGAVFVPKGAQRIMAIRTLIPEQASYRRSVELPGKIIPDPNASGYVQASVGGRVSPPPAGFPRLGAAVKKGDVLAYVTAPLQAIDISDMRQRQGELDQQMSIVERRLARFEQLAPSGAVARSQLEDTRLELQGLKDRRASLDQARRDPEALIAPVDGVVADGSAVAGQIVQSNAVVFHIIDPTRLWIEALSFDSLAGTQGATALLANGRSLPLSHRGAAFADRNQSIPVHFAIEGDVRGLRVGQFVTVLASTDQGKNGLAVPRASIVRSASGQDVVYEHVSAERFQPRPVRIEPLDGERVFIAAGLSPGKRVVVQGAELLDQVR